MLEFRVWVVIVCAYFMFSWCCVVFAVSFYFISVLTFLCLGDWCSVGIV